MLSGLYIFKTKNSLLKQMKDQCIFKVKNPKVLWITLLQSKLQEFHGLYEYGIYSYVCGSGQSDKDRYGCNQILGCNLWPFRYVIKGTRILGWPTSYPAPIQGLLNRWTVHCGGENWNYVSWERANLGPKLHPGGGFFGPWFFIILKNSHQDLYNEGSSFILSSLEVGHWVAQT